MMSLQAVLADLYICWKWSSWCSNEQIIQSVHEHTVKLTMAHYKLPKPPGSSFITLHSPGFITVKNRSTDRKVMPKNDSGAELSCSCSFYCQHFLPYNHIITAVRQENIDVASISIQSRWWKGKRLTPPVTSEPETSVTRTPLPQCPVALPKDSVKRRHGASW